MKRLILYITMILLLSFPFAACAALPDAGVDELPLPPIDTVPPEDQPAAPEPPVDAVPEPEEPDVPEEPEAMPPPAATETLVAATVDGLQVRSGRGSSYRALGTLDEGDMASIVDRRDGWVAIRYLGGIAYVSERYCRNVSFALADDEIERVIDTGETLLGYPYVFGAPRYHWGNGQLNTAFDGKSYDCSSLTQYIYKIGSGLNLATTSREQSLQGSPVAAANIRRGDLLFFTNASRDHLNGLERIGHVALYLGDNVILHTASDHAVIEQISPTRWSYFITARRFL